MHHKVGLWIDHRKAVVVTVTDAREVVRLMISAVEKQPRRAANARHEGSYESQKVRPDDRRENARIGHLNVFYDAVIASISKADAILILGPGEAGSELEKRLEHAGLGDRVVGIEKTDKMTTNQIVARVRTQFTT